MICAIYNFGLVVGVGFVAVGAVDVVAVRVADEGRVCRRRLEAVKKRKNDDGTIDSLCWWWRWCCCFCLLLWARRKWKV